jgi:hypothetical protein
MVHKVHMTEEPAMLTSSHKAEVRVVAIVGDYESAAGREVARARDYVSVYGGALKTQHRYQEYPC